MCIWTRTTKKGFKLTCVFCFNGRFWFIYPFSISSHSSLFWEYEIKGYLHTFRVKMNLFESHIFILTFHFPTPSELVPKGWKEEKWHATNAARMSKMFVWENWIFLTSRVHVVKIKCQKIVTFNLIRERVEYYMCLSESVRRWPKKYKWNLFYFHAFRKF